MVPKLTSFFSKSDSEMNESCAYNPQSDQLNIHSMQNSGNYSHFGESSNANFETCVQIKENENLVNNIDEPTITTNSGTSTASTTV
ncbi:zinc finger MYM-type protein 1-like, partial [Aphis craccivora]